MLPSFNVSSFFARFKPCSAQMRVQQLPTTVHANRFHVAVGLFGNGSQTGRQNVVKKKVGYEAHLSVWCCYHILTSRLWSITEQTYGNMEPIGMHRRWCAQFSSKRLSSNTSSVGTNKSASKIMHMHIFGGSAQTVPKVPTILCNRNWLRCSGWPSVPSWMCRTVIRIIIKHPCASTFTMHFECQVTKEGISVSCKPSERQAKVC